MYEELILDHNITCTNIINKNDLKYSFASYNSVLNCLFLLANDSNLVLFDCNSRQCLKVIDWSQFSNESE